MANEMDANGARSLLWRIQRVWSHKMNLRYPIGSKFILNPAGMAHDVEAPASENSSARFTATMHLTGESAPVEVAKTPAPSGAHVKSRRLLGAS
jgi:hypothetical protein